MSDVNETLQDLMERRLKELGQRRGRGEQISLREAYHRMVEVMQHDESRSTNRDGKMSVPTYEVFRRIRNGHTSITDATASALATMLEVPVDDIYAAARIRPRLTRFELPTNADRLDENQRKVVLAMIDALVAAMDADVPRARLVQSVPRTKVDLVHGGQLGTVIEFQPFWEKLNAEAARLSLRPDEVREAVENAVHAVADDSLHEDVAARRSTD